MTAASQNAAKSNGLLWTVMMMAREYLLINLHCIFTFHCRAVPAEIDRYLAISFHWLSLRVVLPFGA